MIAPLKNKGNKSYLPWYWLPTIRRIYQVLNKDSRGKILSMTVPHLKMCVYLKENCTPKCLKSRGRGKKAAILTDPHEKRVKGEEKKPREEKQKKK
jgi:hypothetical protein